MSVERCKFQVHDSGSGCLVYVLVILVAVCLSRLGRIEETVKKIDAYPNETYRVQVNADTEVIFLGADAPARWQEYKNFLQERKETPPPKEK